MPERGIYRTASIKGYATPTNAPVRVDSTTNALMLAPAGSGTTEVVIPTSVNTTGNKIAAGSGAFVSGVATVNTGLASVLSFQVCIIGTSFATGATEICDAAVSGAPATGTVTVQGFNLGTSTKSASGTGTFTWLAVGS